MTLAAPRSPSEATAIDPALLQKSRAYCRDLTRRAAKNFYYGLKLLPEPKRSAMYALYAYMRLVDDIADDDTHGRTLEKRSADLDQWESLTRQAISAGGGEGAVAGGEGEIPRNHILWPAFAQMVRRHRIPPSLFSDMIAGQRQDLAPLALPDFAALQQYCYRVASVVGVASIYVWGFSGGDATLQLAADRGIAFQLTNILRDLREDAARGRCYLPTEELNTFGLTPDDIAQAEGSASPAFLELMRFSIERAESFYLRSASLEDLIEPDSRPTLRAMTAIYHTILKRIAQNPAQVLQKRVRLTKLNKLLIAWRAVRSRSKAPRKPHPKDRANSQ